MKCVVIMDCRLGTERNMSVKQFQALAPLGIDTRTVCTQMQVRAVSPICLRRCQLPVAFTLMSVKKRDLHIMQSVWFISFCLHLFFLFSFFPHFHPCSLLPSLPSFFFPRSSVILFVYLFFSFLYLLIYLFTFPCSSSLLIMSNKKNRQLRGVCLSVCCVYWYVTPLSVGETDYDKI